MTGGTHKDPPADRTREPGDPDDHPAGSRVDLHVHGRWSGDAIGELDALARCAKRKGLHGIALTEHDTTDHHKALASWNREHTTGGFRFFAAIEVSTRQGHLLAIGVHAPIPKGLGLDETVECVRDAGGVPVPAHPYRWRTGIGEEALARIASQVPLLETWNAQETTRKNALARELATRHGLGATGGSDAHQVHDVGNGYTLFPTRVEEEDDLLQALEQGRSRAAGTRTAWKTRLRQRTRIAFRTVTLRRR